MGSVIIFVVVTVIVGVVLYLVSSLVAGRGEPLPPVAADQTLAELPAGDLSGDDARNLRFRVAVRGYDMQEVDWAIAELAAEIDRLRAASPGTASTSEQPGWGQPERVQPEMVQPGMVQPTDRPTTPEDPRGEAVTGEVGRVES